MHSTWSPGREIGRETSFVRMLVDREGHLLVGGVGSGKMSLNGTTHDANSTVFRPFMVVLSR